MDSGDYEKDSRRNNHNHKSKLNKRDIAVKLMRKQREIDYYEQLARQSEQDDDDQEQQPHAGAGKIILVQNSYLLKENKNHQANSNLPRKWSSKFQDDDSESEEDEEEDQDEDDDNDNDDESDDDDDGDEHSHGDIYHDDDDDDNDYTHQRVVQFIDSMNEVEVIPLAIPHASSRRGSRAGSKSPSFKERAKRVASKSPKLAANTPTFPPLDGLDGGLDSDDDDNGDDDDGKAKNRHNNRRKQGNNTNTDTTDRGRGTPSFYATRKQNNAHSRKMVDQMQALDLGGALSTTAGAPQHTSTHTQHHGSSRKGSSSADHEDGDIDTLVQSSEPVSKPDDDCLDATAWWKYLLSTAAIRRDRKIYLTVVDKFPFAKSHALGEDYFHFPPSRRSQPEQACTAFGLYSAKTLAENGGSKAKKNKKFSLVNLKRGYAALSDEDKLSYTELSLCDKIRYKLQRCEFLYNYNGGKSSN